MCKIVWTIPWLFPLAILHTLSFCPRSFFCLSFGTVERPVVTEEQLILISWKNQRRNHGLDNLLHSGSLWNKQPTSTLTLYLQIVVMSVCLLAFAHFGRLNFSQRLFHVMCWQCRLSIVDLLLFSFTSKGRPGLPSLSVFNVSLTYTQNHAHTLFLYSFFFLSLRREAGENI